ncbi:ABC transporter permease [Streptomyces tagetis]|uniref:ABC transporter permease n=1 Tax=Streptomyces tagetis TaxID=2820809 RepID=A0A941AYJ5_9ACTN|nr:ABC transporter permease [Streptomyces sp. RG38]MBQ0825115.1 ABC transporter permease [Streptomyces sp. RG38]
MNRRLWAIALPVLTTAAAVALWWTASASSTSLYFPPLSDILEAFRANWLSRQLTDIVVPSLWRVGLGMALGTALGVAIGTLIGAIRRIESYVQPQLEFMRALPPILVIPPMILVLGTGDTMKIGVIAASALWPVLLAAVDGARSVEPVRDDMARVFGLGRWARFRWVVLPTAVPHIWGGVQAAMPIAFVVMIASEYYSSTNGLGYFLSQTSTSFRLADMWSAIVLLGVIGVAVNSLVAYAGRRLDRRFGEYTDG